MTLFDFSDKSVELAAELAAALGINEEKSFTFDAVFGPYSTQVEIFDDIAKKTVDDVLTGCTLRSLLPELNSVLAPLCCR